MSYYIGGIDLETSSLNPNTGQVLEIAVILDNFKVQVSNDALDDYLDNLPCFHKYIKWPVYTGEIIAINMNKNVFTILAEDTNEDIIRNDLLYHSLENFFNLHKVKKLIPAGKNVTGFDLPFLRSMDKYNIMGEIIDSYFSHRSVDPAMLYFDPTKDNYPPNLQQCLDRAGVKKKVSHTAVEDVKDVLKLCRLYWNK